MQDTSSSKSTGQAVSAQDVINKEKQYIKEERGASAREDLWALAISGGGIRSASFGLGVMQALVAKGIFSKIDYLSTVSGGGYIGSALTWFLYKGLPDGSDAGTGPDNFPLGQIGFGARTAPERNLILDFIRQHGNYLVPGKGLNWVSLFGVALRSMFVSLIFYLSILTIIMAGFRISTVFNKITFDHIWFLRFPGPITLVRFIWLAIFIILLLALTSMIFSILTFFLKDGAKGYKRFTDSQKRTGLAWTAVFILFLVGSLQYAGGLLSELWQKILAAGTLTTIGTAMGFFEHLRSRNPAAPAKENAFSSLRIIIASAALIYGLLLTAFILSKAFISPLPLIALAAVAVTVGFFVNLNYAGFHRMYRNRLMETFMPNTQNVKENKWGEATEADEALLENMCSGRRRPYHLINTNIVLTDSPTAKFRGRGGDSFLLSPLYCGSNATLYCPTRDYMKKKGRGMTLATAMAISGAAVNPNTGVAGRGPMINRAVSALLGILNLGLGYWAANPNFGKELPFKPNFFIPGLTNNVLGRGLSEDSPIIELTDGGHFENLGLYELFRRKANVIIASDAGADPEFRFGDLANAIERARVDFGVKVRFRSGCDQEGMLPGTVRGAMAEKYALAERGFAVADITYPDKDTNGKLVYIKTTLTGNLPADIYGYRSANPDFPDQTTGDQFFDEEQFEAYRELGYQLTWQMMESEEGKSSLDIKGIAGSSGT